MPWIAKQSFSDSDCFLYVHEKQNQAKLKYWFFDIVEIQLLWKLSFLQKSQSVNSESRSFEVHWCQFWSTSSCSDPSQHPPPTLAPIVPVWDPQFPLLSSSAGPCQVPSPAHNTRWKAGPGGAWRAEGVLAWSGTSPCCIRQQCGGG